MKRKLLFSLAALLSTTTLLGCSQTAPSAVAPKKLEVSQAPAQFNQTLPDSYIVKAPGDGVATIRRVFAQYGVVLVSPLGNEQYELRLQTDPGLAVLNDLTVKSGGAVTSIQPNFVYRSN